MKILIVRNYPIFTDINKITYNIQELGLAKALVKKGYHCDLLLWTNDKEKDLQVSVDETRTINIFYRKGITILKNTIFVFDNEIFNKYEIIQTCEYNQLQSWLLSKKYKNKLVIYHGPYYSEFNKKYNLMCKFFDAIFLKRYISLNTKFLVKSKKAKTFLVNKGIKQENIVTVGVGIDAEILFDKYNIHKENIEFELEKNPEELKLLYIGKIEQRRNTKFLLDVLCNVIKIHPNTKLYVIGTGDKEYVDEITQYIQKLKLSNNIVWQEKLEQKYMSRIYSQTDFFLLPTEYEIFGMVLLEAMYFNNLVITTEHGGSDMLIENGQNGVVLKEKNIELWTKTILDLYNSPEKFNELKEKSSDIIKNKFTWDELANEFIKTYKSIK